MEALTERQKTLIVNNVVKACKNIELLNKTGYNFLYLASGFIAHYSINGFKGHYEEHDLVNNIQRNKSANMWLNFRPGDRDYEYYSSKADVYRRILSQI